MSATKDMIGKRFGRLKVVGQALSLGGRAAWNCICVCGVEKVIRGKDLRLGDSQSCGCVNSVAVLKHGHARRRAVTSEYRSWRRMRVRCLNPHDKRYTDYGGRGIRVCERWVSFEVFLADMGPKPSPKHSIDRINVDGDYEPRNCRWATAIEQRRNRRDSIR